MEFEADAEYDFHQFEELLPFDVEKHLTEFIEDSFVAGHKNLLIITGKGSMVRPTVRKLLPSNKHVKEFRHAGYFNGQDGAFEVILKD